MRAWLMAALAMALLATAGTTGAFAQQAVGVEVSVLGGSVLVQFTNTSEEVIDRFVVWFDSDHVFGSYVAEPGWSATANAGTLTMDGTLEPGQTVKLGIKFEGEGAKLAWQARAGGDEAGIGWILSGREDPGGNAGTSGSPMADPVKQESSGVLPESVFRTIPEKPSAGSVIRLVGSGFGPSQDLSLSVGGVDLEPITADGAGSFVVTRTIPDGLDGRVSFVLTDSEANEAEISMRLEGAQGAPVQAISETLSIDEVGETYHGGAYLDVSGTATPISTIAVSLRGPDGSAITTRAVVVSHDGSWSLDGGITIPLHTPTGGYVIVADDGYDTVQRELVIESSRIIDIEAARIVFEPGDAIRFSGTAMPDQDIYLVLEDPDGHELVTDSIQVDSSGEVQWEYPTDLNSRRGTYTLTATQGEVTEFFYAGLGSVVEIPVRIVFDKANYISSDTAMMTITGEPQNSVTMLIVDPRDNPVITQENIVIQPNGRAVYELDVSGLPSGVYTAIVQKGMTQSSQKFGVQLATASTMSINTREEYSPGESVLVLGTTTDEVAVTITLADPNGEIVQSITTFSNTSGEFSERGLRIPPDATSGIWVIKAASGASSDTAEVVVQEMAVDGLAVSVKEQEGGRLSIVVTGATGSHVTVTVMEDERPIGGEQRIRITGEGVGQTPWNINFQGLYTIIVQDGDVVANYTYHHSP